VSCDGQLATLDYAEQQSRVNAALASLLHADRRIQQRAPVPARRVAQA